MRRSLIKRKKRSCAFALARVLWRSANRSETKVQLNLNTPFLGAADESNLIIYQKATGTASILGEFGVPSLMGVSSSSKAPHQWGATIAVCTRYFPSCSFLITIAAVLINSLLSLSLLPQIWSGFLCWLVYLVLLRTLHVGMTFHLSCLFEPRSLWPRTVYDKTSYGTDITLSLIFFKLSLLLSTSTTERFHR